MSMLDLSLYLARSEIIDFDDTQVRLKANQLKQHANNEHELIEGSFEFVRDDIRHSNDHGLYVINCSASDVLKQRAGYCFAKSHLLAALLRSNGIPTDFCYQRLSLDEHGSRFGLHGLNAVYIRSLVWYKLGPRGNKEGIDAQFDPPESRLALALNLPG
ncbi:MAG: transglutaminase-like putative cysteine protease [Cryomorphaceae bacterium]|jgi:transglutaminase-like putative cysteine protease